MQLLGQNLLYVLDEDRNIRPEEDIAAWAVWMAQADRVVGRADTRDARVSTIFLGVVHFPVDETEKGPLLFETLIFGGNHDGRSQKYVTWGEAERGHNEWVNIVKGEEEIQ